MALIVARRLKGVELREKGRKDLAVPAHCYFLMPVFLGGPLADSPGDEPAKGPRAKLPCGATVSLLGGASLDLPARVGFLRCVPPPEVEKEHLPFHMGRDGSPALFVTVHGLEGGAEKCGNLFLGLVQGLAQVGKFPVVQNTPPWLKPLRAKARSHGPRYSGHMAGFGKLAIRT